MRLLYGFFMGCFIAITGSWKDTLFEKFEILKFFRSPVITEIWYLVLVWRYGGMPTVLILLASAALERVSVEGYKAIRRQRRESSRGEGRIGAGCWRDWGGGNDEIDYRD